MNMKSTSSKLPNQPNRPKYQILFIKVHRRTLLAGLWQQYTQPQSYEIKSPPQAFLDG